MGYISFYRKWRPQSFDQIVGQKYNVRTLKNVLDSNRLSHSYIFCGPRGTGKTSMARILAKAINCQEGITSAPCNRCANCKSISDGSNIDVIEIDAASNRGINEIRELREKVKYLPNELRKKIYIIDEVHMLTTEAFNALLKVLEEPPEHVIFIMATTEPNKVIPTIMSRCQRFDFYPVPLELIKDRLRKIAGAEKVSISDAALDLVAKYAEGSLRDADGILEQLASYSEGKIEASEVVSLLGVVDLEVLFEFIDILAARDVKRGLSITASIIKGNNDLKNFVAEVIDHLYNLFAVKNYEKPFEIIELSQDYLERYRKQAQNLQNEELDYYIEHFTELLARIKWGESSRTFFKSSVIKALNYIVLDDRQMEKKARAWEARLDAMERKVNNPSISGSEGSLTERDLDIISREDMEDPGRVRSSAIVSEEDAVREINNDGGRGKVEKQDPGEKTGEGEVKFIEDNLEKILENLKKKKISVYAMFIEAVPSRVEHGTLYFYLEENKEWHRDHLNKTANSGLISSVIKEVSGREYRVMFETGKARPLHYQKGEERETGGDERERAGGLPEGNKTGPALPAEKECGPKKAGKEKDDEAGKEEKESKDNHQVTEEEDVMEYFEKKFDIKE